MSTTTSKSAPESRARLAPSFRSPTSWLTAAGRSTVRVRRLKTVT
jgi:hypothetical protein